MIANNTPFMLWTTLFFVALILAMAVIPLICRTWWRKWYALVTATIAVPCVVVVGFIDAGALPGVAEEYVSFIFLIGSLYIISGGIDVEIPARGRPGSNVLFLLTGAVMANVLGTTGASVVLIRPLLRANSWRKHVVHVFVFFIFIVSNIGGMLTPLGDPPLFLGYLQGVPFFWTLKLFPVWGVSVGVLLGVFWLLDRHQIRREDEAGSALPIDGAQHHKFELHGAWNIVLLSFVIASLFLPQMIRTGVIIVAVLLSILMTPTAIRKRNHFTYHPILEVAILFAGIFVTLIPVQACVQSFHIPVSALSPMTCFWGAGGFSSILDNAPTYLIFFNVAREASGAVSTGVAGVPESLLTAIASGCVMMGANTYIGNGPNLMVKAMCEDEGLTMPSFLGYMGWAALGLGPLYVLVSWLFFV
jgi:Na+/H+ antiporter NhaD/arsenite permease-like protein